MYRKIGLFFLLLALAGVVAFWSLRVKEPQIEVNQTFSESGIEFGYQKATSTSKGPRRAAPDLSRAIPGGLSTIAKTKMENIISLLRRDPNNAVLWSELGLYRKEVGDYEGTKEVWEFALELQPQNAIFAENLGVLYGWYLGNPAKAEAMLLRSVKIEPMPHRYLRLSEFYREVMNNSSQADKVLRDAGIK